MAVSAGEIFTAGQVITGLLLWTVFNCFDRYNFFNKIISHCLSYIFPPLTCFFSYGMPLLNDWVTVGCISLALAAVSGCHLSDFRFVWLSASCFGCCLLKWLNKFVVLPSDVWMEPRQTLHVILVQPLASGKKPNQAHPVEVEFFVVVFFRDQLCFTLAFGHGFPWYKQGRQDIDCTVHCAFCDLVGQVRVSGSEPR